MQPRPMYCIRVNYTLNKNKSMLNCCKVVKGCSFWRLEAFCSLSAIKRKVYDVTAEKPVATENSQVCQSKFAIVVKPLPIANIMISEESRIPQLRYQETTASWNFFIFLIEIEPLAVRNGLMNRTMYKRYVITVLASGWSEPSFCCPTTTTITQLTVSKIIRISNFFILSLRIKKASTTVIRGAMLLTTAMRVRGRNFVTE